MILTVPAVPVEISRAATSEIRKITSLRSSWMLPAICAAIGLVAAVGSAVQGSRPDSHGSIATGTVTVGLYLALIVAIAGSAVSGALGSGSEYKQESLPLTVLFTPDRDLLFGAKLGVTAAYSLVLGLSAEIGATLGLLAFGRHKVEFGLRLVAAFGGGLLAAICWGLIGASLGLLLRSSLQAIIAMAGWLIVLEPLVWLVVNGAGIPGLAVLLPESATIGTVAVDSFPKSHFLAPAAGSAVVLVLWTAAAGTAAWWYLRKRDI